MSRARIYALYDTEYYEQCVRIGTAKEIAEFLNCSPNTILSAISRRRNGKRRNLLNSRYEIEEWGEI